MKRIFHFVKSNNLSGLENVVINICTLVKGYDYTYVSTNGPIKKYLKYYGIKHITIPSLTPWSMLNVIKTYNPDIVQAHDARASVLLAPSYFYCKKHHIKMISELHNNDPKMKKWWRLRSILYAISSKFFNNIIEVSRDIMKDYSFRWLINKNKVTFIQNVINPYRVKNMILDNTNTTYNIWDCIFVGRFSYQKDPLRFIKIINDLKEINPDIKAVMVGSGKLLSRSERMINDLNLSKNVKCVGFQKNPYKYMQRSKVLIITSRFEGLCLVSLEAMMLGLPVISTPLYGLKHIINNSCGGFETNNKDFVQQINSLLTNKKLYIHSSYCALEQIHKVNNIFRFIKSYKQIYK